MKANKPSTGVIVKRTTLDGIESIHPHKMLSYLIMSVSCLLYAVISYFFIQHLSSLSNEGYNFTLPKFFTISTIIIVISGLFASRLVRAYQNDDITTLRKQLGFLLISGLLFFISQSMAWIELLNRNIVLDNNGITAYLLIFTVMQLALVFVGMILTAILFYKYMLIENDLVKTLIMVTNPHEKIRLEIYTAFWYFNLISWTMIFLMLLFIF